MMEEIKRFGVSMEAGLLELFDRYLQDHAYTNRSEAIRDLVRRALVQEEWDHDRETVGAISIVYNHHVPELTRKINEYQHEFPGEVVASMHVHLDRDNCMEVIVARGKANEIKALADRLIAARGVLHGTLTGSTLAAPFKADAGPKSSSHAQAGHHHSHLPPSTPPSPRRRRHE